MIPFAKRFPELGPQETRVACIEDDGGFPRGRYAFHESYCEEENCECHRVMLTVIEESAPGKIWASISFGWDLPEWFTDGRALERLGATASGAFLDPLYPQSEHAAELLDLFEWMITQDPAYVERLKRHYTMFKGAPSPREPSLQAPHSQMRAKRPKPELLKKQLKSQ
jgi:hypothetical protein